MQPETARSVQPPVSQGRPLFLHFLNRELNRALGKDLDPEFCARHVLLGAVTTDAPLASSLAFVWESGVLDAPSGAAVRDLLMTGELLLISEFVTLDEFLSSVQRLYRHDRTRYPMYFRDSPGQLEAARPSLDKGASTTAFLSARIEELLGGDPSVVDGMVRSDVRGIMRRRGVIDAAMVGREERAITLSLFKPEPRAPDDLVLGRMLSFLHLSHYLDFVGADIMTGIEGLTYFDAAARQFPRHDAWYSSLILAHLGLDLRRPRTDWGALVAARGSLEHQVFQELFGQLVHGLEDQVASRSEAGGLVRRHVARRLMSEWTGPAMGELAAGSLYDAGTARLSEIIAAGVRRSAGFRRFQELYRAGGNAPLARVLILVANDLERDAVITAAAGAGKRELRRTFIPFHTVFHLGVIGGAEVLLVQSEQGTESPGGMTLTARELIEQCNPDYMVLTGIAYGLREKEQRLGEVLVSARLRLIDPRKVAEDESGQTVIARGDMVSSPVTVLDRFRSAGVDWHGTRVHFGLLLSGSILINSASLRNELARLEPDAIGGEMEGAGLYCAGAKKHVEWIVAKGISDWRVTTRRTTTGPKPRPTPPPTSCTSCIPEGSPGVPAGDTAATAAGNNPPEAWAWSDAPTHPALVSLETFIDAQKVARDRAGGT